MKKLVFGIIAAAMMVLGLSAAPAQADPYPGTVGTSVTITAKRAIPAHGAAILRAIVTPKSGSVIVTGGKTQMVCARSYKGRFVSKVGPAANYPRGIVRLSGPILHAKGLWSCHVRYLGAGVFDSSHSRASRVRVF